MIAVLTGGGPTALIAVLGLVIWHQNRVITAIKEEVTQIQGELHKVQIIHGQESNLKADMTAQISDLKSMIRDHILEARETTSRIFKRIEEQNARCGRDCLASLIVKEKLSGGQK